MNIAEDKRLEKNKTIRERGKETRSRHSLMDCKVYTCKIQSNSLSLKQKEQLKMMFIEAKWLKNYIINWSKIEGNNIWKFNTKIKNITHKDKDMNDVPVELKYLGSQIKQDLLKQILSNIKTISTLKKKGIQKNGGQLKYCKEYTSLSLPQYELTYSIKSNNRIKIQGIKKTVKINGLEQFINKPNIEIANGNLLNRPDGYYIQFTVFQPKEQNVYTKDIVGIDFGCSTSFTLSTGEKFNVSIPESDRLKLLQKKLARQKKMSENWYKTKQKIKIEYQHISNIKNDKTKKFIHKLNDYEHIVIQDEQLKNWHKGHFGKTIQHSILGRVKSILKKMPNVTILSKWEPTTKMCPVCGQINKISLSQRTYICDCGYSCDRDIHSANNMLIIYYKKYVPTEHRDFKPVEKNPLYNTSNDTSKVQVFSTKQETTLHCECGSSFWAKGIDSTFNNIKIKVDSNRPEYSKGTLKDGITISDVWTDIPALPHNAKEKVNHPTQKPIKLMERIVSLFTNENDTVLDFCMGSGSTGVACLNLNRNFIGIEKDTEYFNIAKKRMDEIGLIDGVI